MRTATIDRKTLETNIRLSLTLNSPTPEFSGTSGIGFFDHMLTLFCHHSGFALDLSSTGDLHVDGHHTVEDIGICLGEALREALGDKRGIARYGNCTLPMDETLAEVYVDISNRPYLVLQTPPLPEMIGCFDTQLTEEFLRALSVHGGLTLHTLVRYGKNGHHIIEAIFKALARALKMAVCITGDGVSSSKGLL